MNAGIFDHRVSSVAVDAKVTVTQTRVHAHKLASSAKYVSSIYLVAKMVGVAIVQPYIVA
jgi:hypothetical protein